VATTALGRLAQGVLTDRPDVAWPERYWEQFVVAPRSSRSLEALIEPLVPAEETQGWREVFDAPPDVPRDLWCERLAAAAHRARAGEPVPELAAELMYPFLVHAEYRRRLDVDLAGAESYVAGLGDRLAAALS
jgi:hypothetical protein